MIVEKEGNRVQVRERKAEFEESASDDEEGVASIGEGSSVRCGAEHGEGGMRGGDGALARGLETTEFQPAE